MFFGRSDAKNPGLLPTKPLLPHTPNPVWAEVLRLVWFTAATLLLASLISHSPTDPSWTNWTSRTHYVNWIGRTGSILSDLLFQLFGMGGFCIAAVFLAHAFTKHRFIPEKDDHHFSWLSPLFFLLSVSTFFQIAFPQSWNPWGFGNAGGMAGKTISYLLLYLVGKIGAFAISLCASLCATIFVFRWKIVSKTTETIKRELTTFRTKVPEWKVKASEIIWKYLSRISIPRKIQQASAKSELPPPPPAPPAATLKSTVPPGVPAEAYDEPIQTEISVGTEQLGDDDLLRSIANTHRKLSDATAKPKLQRKPNQPFQLPSLSSLSGKAESKTRSVDKNWYLEKANILVQKLKDFGVEGEVVHISPGPVITVYEFKPASGVKIKEIANLSDDLTLALSVLSVRIVAPIPGKPVVGIEIPSPHREMVFFKDMVQETPFYKEEVRIPIALGRLASGEAVTVDLASMPHLLVAGSTGTGKSVFINSLIASLLYRFTPNQLKLILVDPKMVELSLYEGIPHLLLPVVVDSKKAALALRWTVDEMERRYTLMHQFGVRHLDSYNARVAEYHKKGQALEYSAIPYIVVVIDEYADLMAVVPKDVELSIARLAQKARASGIHLVLATQRPSTDVVTGTIKANFPSRISFRVASSVDSKTILDRTGAERLLGHGDMLLHSAGFTSLKRMQGAFVSDADVQTLVDHLKSQGEPEYDDRILKSLEEQADGETSGGTPGFSDDANEEDRLYDAAIRIVTEKGEASISLIQRHLRIGYNRAALLMDRMEKEGVVAQSTGNSKRRLVIANQI